MAEFLCCRCRNIWQWLDHMVADRIQRLQAGRRGKDQLQRLARNDLLLSTKITPTSIKTVKVLQVGHWEPIQENVLTLVFCVSKIYKLSQVLCGYSQPTLACQFVVVRPLVCSQMLRPKIITQKHIYG